MKKTFRVVIVAALLLAAVLPLHGQLPRDPEERKKVLAQIFEANARQLTLFDRDGKAVGPRDVFRAVYSSRAAGLHQTES